MEALRVVLQQEQFTATEEILREMERARMRAEDYREAEGRERVVKSFLNRVYSLVNRINSTRDILEEAREEMLQADTIGRIQNRSASITARNSMLRAIDTLNGSDGSDNDDSESNEEDDWTFCRVCDICFSSFSRGGTIAVCNTSQNLDNACEECRLRLRSVSVHYIIWTTENTKFPN